MTKNLSKVKNILQLNSEQRFNYFVRKVTDFEIVWGLYKDGWATVSTESGEGIPFWPEADFANLCATDVWCNYCAREINLTDFITKWLPGMMNDDKVANIFPIPDGKSYIVEPAVLLNNLSEELKQYE